MSTNSHYFKKYSCLKYSHLLLNLLKNTLLSLEGFPLASNCSSLAENSEILHIKESDSVSTLGVVWSSHLDSFTLKVDLNRGKISILNKRILLSEISKLFDSLGWFSPVIVLAKILICGYWIWIGILFYLNIFQKNGINLSQVYHF